MKKLTIPLIIIYSVITIFIVFVYKSQINQLNIESKETNKQINILTENIEEITNDMNVMQARLECESKKGMYVKYKPSAQYLGEFNPVIGAQSTYFISGHPQQCIKDNKEYNYDNGRWYHQLDKQELN